MTEGQTQRRGLSRRSLLTGAGGLAVGATVGAALDHLVSGSAESNVASPPEAATVPFYGPHQGGITTPPQHYLHFATFDVTSQNVSDLRTLLQQWTAAGARMANGMTAVALSGDSLAPPEDTGESLDLSAARLTLTVGFGPSLFALGGVDRFGLAARRPAALVDLPQFRNDNLEPARSGGDICVQACADDPQVAFHAVRNFARIGRGTVVMRWSQLGFSKTSSASHAQATPRNLMGFKDGTNNLQTDDTAAVDQFVWDNGSETAWMGGGSYLVARRIRMRIETWDRSSLSDQEATIGRAKGSGAPLGKVAEFDPTDLAANDADGKPAVPMDAHIRLAAPATNANEKILRRGYSFTDGMDAFGELDAGLFFVAFQRDPRLQFIQIQQRLAENDALNEYISHTGSAIFACPPGVTEGGWLGQSLVS